MHYAQIKIVVQKPSYEAVEQDEDTEEDGSIVSESDFYIFFLTCNKHHNCIIKGNPACGYGMFI